LRPKAFQFAFRSEAVEQVVAICAATREGQSVIVSSQPKMLNRLSLQFSVGIRQGVSPAAVLAEEKRGQVEEAIAPGSSVSAVGGMTRRKPRNSAALTPGRLSSGIDQNLSRLGMARPPPRQIH
jgi:hypothetical protein